MAIFNKLMGQATMDDVELAKSKVKDYLLDGEVVIMSFTFMRDSIILTTEGIYYINVQNLSGAKVETKFFPSKSVKYVSIESAGTLDFDADIKIGVDGNTVVLPNLAYNAPISFKIPRNQYEEARHLIKLIKKHYLKH